MIRPGNDAAQRAASLFSIGPEEEDTPGVFSMTFRLPSSVAATIAVMANHAGKSRNEMAHLIINAGIQAIYSATPEPIQEELREAIADQIDDFA